MIYVIKLKFGGSTHVSYPKRGMDTKNHAYQSVVYTFRKLQTPKFVEQYGELVLELGKNRGTGMYLRRRRNSKGEVCFEFSVSGPSLTDLGFRIKLFKLPSSREIYDNVVNFFKKLQNWEKDLRSRISKDNGEIIIKILVLGHSRGGILGNKILEFLFIKIEFFTRSLGRQVLIKKNVVYIDPVAGTTNSLGESSHTTAEKKDFVSVVIYSLNDKSSFMAPRTHKCDVIILSRENHGDLMTKKGSNDKKKSYIFKGKKINIGELNSLDQGIYLSKLSDRELYKIDANQAKEIVKEAFSVKKITKDRMENIIFSIENMSESLS